MKIIQVKTHKSYIIKKRSNNIKWHNVGLNCGSAVRTIAPLFSNRNFRASRIEILTRSCPNSTRPWSLADERITPCNHTLSFPFHFSPSLVFVSSSSSRCRAHYYSIFARTSRLYRSSELEAALPGEWSRTNMPRDRFDAARRCISDNIFGGDNENA